jgi:hypothetical protein
VFFDLPKGLGASKPQVFFLALAILGMVGWEKNTWHLEGSGCIILKALKGGHS